MPAFKLIISACIFWTTLAAAQSSHQITIQYDREIKNRQLLYRISLLAETRAIDSIGQALSDEGYLANSVKYSGDTLIIDPGERFRVGDIELMTITAAEDVEKRTITRYRNIDATSENIAALKSDILTPYQNDGYYFASLNTDRVIMKEGEIAARFKLITGPLVSVRRVRFKGLKKTNPDFVSKLLGLKEGDPFFEERYLSAIRRIETGDFLRNDSLPRITPNQNYDGVELLFYLSELKSNRLELGGGYLPGRGTEEGTFVGRVRFESKNLFGNGRRINLLFDRKDRASSRADFRFSQPFFIPDHLELMLHFSQIDYDSSYNSFTIDGSLNIITRGNTRFGGGMSWTRTEPQRLSQPPSRILAGILTYDIQKLDFAPNPSSGRHLKIELSYLRRTSWPDSIATTIINNESMFKIAADNFINLGKSLVARINLESSVLITSRDLIDYSEQFKLGGYGSLRGYRQDQFAGRRILLGQIELRLRPSRRTAAYLFTDIGYVYSRKEITPDEIDTEDIARIGSGIGLYIGNSTARMTLEIGWGRHDRADEGKVHFGLITLF